MDKRFNIRICTVGSVQFILPFYGEHPTVFDIANEIDHFANDVDANNIVVYSIHIDEE